MPLAGRYPICSRRLIGDVYIILIECCWGRLVIQTILRTLPANTWLWPILPISYSLRTQPGNDSAADFVMYVGAGLTHNSLLLSPMVP